MKVILEKPVIIKVGGGKATMSHLWRFIERRYLLQI